jgi:ParB family transcriptional regulator, chromosome partitioning protein
MADKRPALGKGLSALIPDVVPEPRTAVLDVDVDRLSPSAFQPRAHIEPAGIEELARSIRANGIIQPILVRRDGAGYQIIAGERRWRAAQHAGLLKVPVIVKDVASGQDGQILQMALIENIQRQDLNPIEEALAYRRLIDEFGFTQERVAEAVGKDRSSVANTLRLLRLPLAVRDQVGSDALTMGHARALLGLDTEAAIAKACAAIVARRLSVRETEALVKRMSTPPPVKPAPVADVHTRAAEQDLRLALGAPVRIVRARKGGRIEIDFTSEDDLQRLYEALNRR